GSTVAWKTEDGIKNARLSAVYRYVGTDRVKTDEAEAGDIVAVAGLEEVQIGDTLADPAQPEALERIVVEEPTIKIRFIVNNGPFAGKSGKWVTSRHIKSRLEKEAKRNLALRVETTDETDTFIVYGRGELMLAVLAETMRREGFEFCLGMPEVVVREEDGQKLEPVEKVVVDVPEEYVGAVTTLLGERRGQMTNMATIGAGRSRVEFKIPSRGLIGFRSQFLTETRGLGLLNTLHDGWEPYAGAMLRRSNGAMVADRSGSSRPYALFNLQPRGIIFIPENTEVYEGMIIGEHSRANDLDVNATKEKKLTNMRASGKDEAVQLTTAKAMSIDEALEWIDRDELVEVTPDAMRLRKKHLKAQGRPRRDGT
ncbi:MAG: translational GTPase TypA, partial [Polyangiaceae bacterium]|nr:translational GTPase TypA [Polyangiaceae bacterium]